MTLLERVLLGLRGGPRNPAELRDQVSVLERFQTKFSPKAWSNMQQHAELEDLQRRLQLLEDLAQYQPDLREPYPGPWNVATSTIGRLFLVEGDSLALLTLIQVGKAVGVRILGLGVEDRPAGMRLTGCAPIPEEWVYPRLEWALQAGRVLRMEPPPPAPPKANRKS
jgi:hypothetical protein